MFRREVARQAGARKDDAAAKPITAEVYARFDPNVALEDTHGLPDPLAKVARLAVDQVSALKVSQRGTISAVIGERGAGKSTFLSRLAEELEARSKSYVHEEPSVADSVGEVSDEEDAREEAARAAAVLALGEGERHDEYGKLTIRRIQCPPGGFRQLQRRIAESVGLDRHASAEEIIDVLSDQAPLIFLIDDAHRLVRPAIGGLDGLDNFADFARRVRGEASWVTTIGAAAWQYVSRARGDRVFFDQIVQLERWSEKQIGALIRARCDSAGVVPVFDDIVIPRQFDVATVGEGELTRRPSESERAELGFYRILWDYAKGNPAVALHFWRESLVLHAAGTPAAQIKVRLFQEPSAAALDDVGATLHFVLRAVVQLEVASPSDLVACTQLPPADVADALRFAQARGWIVQVRGEHYRVTWHWYRAITNMLRRQHLLVI
nr:AAA family ATPase [Pseudenhygromyxa sp. WMMC2535]